MDRGEKKTQHTKIIRFMRSFGSITTWMSFKHLHVTRLPARIPELRKKGYLINDAWIKRNGKRFKAWSLVEGRRRAA